MIKDTLATRLKRLRQEATLTYEEILARMYRNPGRLTDEELARRARKSVGSWIGLTQAELSERTKAHRPPNGVERTAIGKFESGKRTNPGLEILQALASALGVTIDDLTPNTQLPSQPNNTQRQVLLSRVSRKVEGVDDITTLQRIIDYIEFITSH